ncbi:MAG: hypothetical protein LC792_15300 [Actinobacteria bacterium]|nr:hypothetical protein [Actinomycetota bacterium]
MTGARVLAVGIEPRTVLSTLTSVLTWEGMEARVVAGAEDAMAAIDANPPDIVFVGDLSVARALADAVGEAPMALIVESVGLKLEEAAYKLHVRPFSADDVVGLARFLKDNAVIDLDAVPVAEHWWDRLRHIRV